MTVPARISVVTLGVRDLARSVAFYEALGWRRSPVGGDEVAFFATADSVLALYPFHALAADAGIHAGSGPAVGGVALALNVDGEAEVDRVIDVALEAGATLLRAAERAPWGGYSGYIADPDGHLWEIACNPGFPLDERGSVILPD